MEISFRVPGDCVPWARAGGRGSRHFTPQKQRNYMAVVRDLAQRAMGELTPIEGPCAMRLVFTYAWPKSMSARRRADPVSALKTSTPDTDNLSKIIKDSLNGIVYRDDAQVCDLHVWKRYGDHPGVKCLVVALGGGP